MSITVKNVKVIEAMSRETLCFTAEVYLNGEYVGSAQNEGCGGSALVAVKDQSVHEQLVAAAKQSPLWAEFVEEIGGESPYVCPVDVVVSELVDLTDLMNQNKNNTLVRLPEDPEGMWRVVGERFSPELAADLRARHRRTDLVILNERVS